VVVAVIALLISVLVPAISSARARGMQAVGLSNLRQLQIANTLYANTNNEHYSPAAVDMQGPLSVRKTENTHRWFATRNNQSEPFLRQDGPLLDYLDADGGTGASVGVRRDPAFAGVLDELQALCTTEAGFEVGCGGYGYNAAFVGSMREQDKWKKWQYVTRIINGVTVRIGDDLGSRQSRFRSPTETVVFADTALAKDRLIEYSFVEPPFWPNIPKSRPDPSIHFRHRGQANVVWLDGHATSERQSLTQDSMYYPARASELNLGWFGDASSNTLFDYQ